MKQVSGATFRLVKTLTKIAVDNDVTVRSLWHFPVQARIIEIYHFAPDFLVQDSQLSVTLHRILAFQYRLAMAGFSSPHIPLETCSSAYDNFRMFEGVRQTESMSQFVCLIYSRCRPDGFPLMLRRLFKNEMSKESTSNLLTEVSGIAMVEGQYKS